MASQACLGSPSLWKARKPFRSSDTLVWSLLRGPQGPGVLRSPEAAANEGPYCGWLGGRHLLKGSPQSALQLTEPKDGEPGSGTWSSVPGSPLRGLVTVLLLESWLCSAFIWKPPPQGFHEPRELFSRTWGLWRVLPKGWLCRHVGPWTRRCSASSSQAAASSFLLRCPVCPAGRLPGRASRFMFGCACPKHGQREVAVPSGSQSEKVEPLTCAAPCPGTLASWAPTARMMGQLSWVHLVSGKAGKEHSGDPAPRCGF